jgi:hypothetical protein
LTNFTPRRVGMVLFRRDWRAGPGRTEGRESRAYTRERIGARRVNRSKSRARPVGRCSHCGMWGAVGQQAIQGLSRVAVNASGVGEGDWVALQAAVRVAGLAEVPTRRDVAATRRRESTPSWTQPCLARSFESGHKPQLARREIADGSCILPS